MLEYVAYTCKGKGRNKNEDRVMVENYLLSNGGFSGESDDSIVAVVCDGVGGEKGGAVAAEISTTLFADLYQPDISALVVSRYLNKANRVIMEKQKKDRSLHNMATTVAGIILCNQQYYIFGVGDSRVYEIRDHQLIQHTDDNIVKNEDSLDYGRLTRYIGGDGKACFPVVKRGSIKGKRSCFLICSDGLYKTISDESIKKICESELKRDDKRKAIMWLAQHNGLTDDISFVLLDFFDNTTNSS